MTSIVATARLARCGHTCFRLFGDCTRMGKKQIIFRFIGSLVPVLIMLIMQIFITAFPPPPDIREFGIKARTAWGLIGLIDWPFLHVNWGHFGANVAFVLFLGFLVLIRGTVLEYLLIWLSSQVIGGFFVWLTGYSNVSVIGASGVIMGFFASILIRAWVERTFFNIIWAGVIILFYGSTIIVALLPGRSTEDYAISWQAHLFGFLAGLLAGGLIGLYRRKYPDARFLNPEASNSDVTQDLEFGMEDRGGYTVSQETENTMMEDVAKSFNPFDSSNTDTSNPFETTSNDFN